MTEGTGTQVLKAIGDLNVQFADMGKRVEKLEIKSQEMMTLMLSLVQSNVTTKNDIESLKDSALKAKFHEARTGSDLSTIRRTVERIEGKGERLENTVLELHKDVVETINMLSTHTDAEFRQTRNEMASKDHLDRKVDGLEVSIGGSLRQVDKKDTALVENLLVKKIISSQESENLITMSPFPVRA